MTDLLIIGGGAAGLMAAGAACTRGLTTAVVEHNPKGPGLYFAGEVLDVDARTGGYNLQIAWATAQAAVRAIGNDT